MNDNPAVGSLLSRRRTVHPSATSEVKQGLAVAFVGTYGPRRCGIGSFVTDLALAVTGRTDTRPRVTPMVLAVTEPSGRHQYPSEVKFEIRQDVRADYVRAAEFVNHSAARLVSIQHEYGIFGADDGAYILDFMEALRVPAIVTLHTVLKHPSENQARIVQTLASSGAQLVVMSEVARELLLHSYGVRGAHVRLIPHGIPVMNHRPDRRVLKGRFGAEGRPVLLTFGLLSPNKGIETAIRALPQVVAAFPDLLYFVVGATHPEVARREGEGYRTMLEREAEKLGVREHVVFRDQFVSSDELRQYLLAADIFVSPYLNEAQATSGALSYAMGAGAAVVSTPYWHAQELLSGGRGCLFPFRDHDTLASILLGLLSSPSELERVRDAAAAFAESMVWPRIGDAYFELFETTLRATKPRPAARPNAERTRALPELRLDHLLRMTDDTGIIQHATYSVPARRSGYCVDDNARALMVAVQADRSHASHETRALVTKYLAYLDGSQTVDGSFHNFMSYERTFESGPPSDDCIGRAIYALGVTACRAGDEGCRLLAAEMLSRALPRARTLGPRGTAQAVMGLVSVLSSENARPELRELLDELVQKLSDWYRDSSSGDWRWFEATLTYDNAMLPLALFAAYRVTGDRASLRDARESLDFLERLCFQGDQLQLVGNDGWYSRGGERAFADEQAIDAAAFVLAFRCAYEVTTERHYLRRMRAAFAWFLGRNRVGLPVYDFVTAGCRDGIGTARLNQNQGAESTLCFLMSLLTVRELAAEGVEEYESHAMFEDRG